MHRLNGWLSSKRRALRVTCNNGLAYLPASRLGSGAPVY